MKITFILFAVSILTKSYSQISVSSDFSYPIEAIENRVQGKVFVKFTTLPTGDIIDSTIHVIQGLGYGLNQIAVNAIKNAPPLARNAITRLKKDTTTQYILPILFVITSKDWANHYFIKGLEEQASGKHLEAVDLFLKAISFVGKNAEYHIRICRSYSKLGNKKLACKHLKRAKKIDKSHKLEWVKQCK